MDLNADGVVNVADLWAGVYLLVGLAVSGVVLSFRQQIWGWIWKIVKKIAGAAPAPTAQQMQSQQADADLKVAQLTLFWQTMYAGMQSDLKKMDDERDEIKAELEGRLDVMQHELASMDARVRQSEKRYQRLVRAVRLQPDGGASVFQAEQDLAAAEKKEREE